MVLPSGLQYIVLKAGKGESPKASDKVTIHYRGTLINGKEFDSSYGRGEPSSFALGGVIPGFREAITHMKPGAKWKVFIPSGLGYGSSGAGSTIGPNETLIFEIELLWWVRPRRANNPIVFFKKPLAEKSTGAFLFFLTLGYFHF